MREPIDRQRFSLEALADLSDPEISRRFDREALAISRLDQPGFVQVFDVGTTDAGMKYLVMQLLEGSELRKQIDGPMEHARVVRLGGQILAALDHAHRRGLVHRDLKPENVFVVRDDDGDEQIKLVDFGIVKLLEKAVDNETLTQAGVIFGTPRYMAPEQVTGGTIDARTDLYAVGVLLHEMICGKPPFDAEDATMVLRMHMIADAPPLPETTPEPMRALVASLLQKRPQDRPSSARDARLALEQVTGAAPPPPPATHAVAVAGPVVVVRCETPP